RLLGAALGAVPPPGHGMETRAPATARRQRVGVGQAEVGEPLGARLGVDGHGEVLAGVVLAAAAEDEAAGLDQSVGVPGEASDPAGHARPAVRPSMAGAELAVGLLGSARGA